MIARRHLRTVARPFGRVRSFARRTARGLLPFARGAASAWLLPPQALFWRQRSRSAAGEERGTVSLPSVAASLPSITWVSQVLHAEHHHHHLTRVQLRGPDTRARTAAALPTALAPSDRQLLAPAHAAALTPPLAPQHTAEGPDRWRTPATGDQRSGRAPRLFAPSAFQRAIAAARAAPSDASLGAADRGAWRVASGRARLAVARPDAAGRLAAGERSSPFERRTAPALHPRRGLARARLVAESEDPASAEGASTLQARGRHAARGPHAQRNPTSVTLTWRAAESTPELVAGGSTPSVSAGRAVAGTSDLVTPSVPRVASPSARDLRAAAPAAPALPPAEVERIAEDVMRRIDRRLRIERERRGR